MYMAKGIFSFFVLLSLPCIWANTYLSSLTINNTFLPEGDCVRFLGPHYNAHVPSIDDPQMACGLLPNSGIPANRKCVVEAGTQIGVQWHQNSNGPEDTIIEKDYRGPCLAYLAREKNGTYEWFKIFEYGYVNVTHEFCVDFILSGRPDVPKGYFNFTIPWDIEPGNYTLRVEIISLHEAFNIGGSRSYVGCAELYIHGNGTQLPPTVHIPGNYSKTEPGILIDIHNLESFGGNYVVPGPPVYTPIRVPSGSGGDSGDDGGDRGGDDDSDDDGGLSTAGKASIIVVSFGLAGVVALSVFYYKKNGSIFGYSFGKEKKKATKDNYNYKAFGEETL